MRIRALEQPIDAKGEHIDRLATENEMKDKNIERLNCTSKAQERQIEIRDEHIKCLVKRIGDVDRGYWRTKEHQLQRELVQANHVIDHQKELVRQMENILIKIENERNTDFSLTIVDSAIRDELNTLTEIDANLRAHNLAVEQQNDAFCKRNAAMEAR
jgi:hypothetical protein